MPYLSRTRSAIALLLLIAITTGGCGLVRTASAREVGQGFSDALEGTSMIPMEAYLAPNADTYLQDGRHLSRQAFLDHMDRLRRGYDFFHRMSRVYATRGGAGWLLDTVHAADAETAANATRAIAQATLWMEATIVSGQVRQLTVHFTVETLQSIRQSPAAYAAKMTAQSLPLPEGWANGTAATAVAAEALDAQLDAAQRESYLFLPAPITAVASAVLLLRVVVARGHRQPDPMARSFGARNNALLLAVRERRECGRQEQENSGGVRAV